MKPEELTLEIVRFCQMPVDSECSPVRWLVVPSTLRMTRPTIAAWLAAAPKPLVVAPLAAPGEIGAWEVGTLDPSSRARVEWERANAREYLVDKLRVCSVPDDAPLVFETAAGRCELAREAFDRWVADYMLTSCGITIRRNPAEEFARVLVLRSDGLTWSPGRVCER